MFPPSATIVGDDFAIDGDVATMSAALNAQADTSAQSSGTVPDISLGSFASTFSTPARKLRIPSTSTGTTAVSPPNGSFSKRRAEEATPISKRFGHTHTDDVEEEEVGDVLDTPDARKGSERWGEATDASAPGRPKRTRSAGSKGGINLTLRDQEKVRPYTTCLQQTLNVRTNRRWRRMLL